MIYKGYQILAVVMMPRAFAVKNSSDDGIDYGVEVLFKPPPKVSSYRPHRYIATNTEQQLESPTLKGIKKLIKEQL